MSLEARLDKIPNFIKAQSPRGLRLAMLKNNIKNSYQYVYHDIQFADGYWFAWYYVTMTAEEIANDTNGAGEV